MPEAELKESGYSAFERFLYMFLIPLLFTAALLGVMMQVFFGYDVIGGLQSAGNKIPGINMIVPDPKSEETEAAANGAGPTPASVQSDPAQADTPRIAELEQQLNQAAADLRERDDTIVKLEEELRKTKEQLDSKTISNEEYDKRIRELSDMYAKMSPTKAAPILESMTPSEAALILGQMKPELRGKLLERMNPKTAADLTAMLKDSASVRDVEIAALQERLQANSGSSGSGAQLTTTEMGATFSGMDPKSAADLLLAMYGDNPSKTLAIIGAMDSAARARVLGEMTKLNKTTAALISGKLSG
ncbi:magnesium transporter MgtE N-terminal domain-containing protein [Paenibacillus thermoaerophilus]|uniref:Magnesium transporter MgtE N-terminal domain-containing protein n=1 Tax=Paenibacillus thermoaerophilus TaxID=1215385 RepID=A0ABW2V611_9BACL|nr:hypothetical protein [Paenibacillus thermoaerophilus]TMV13797.1 hypothetical protein FE781_11395 [Paenibacillus thermoaerophilus]